MVTSVQIPMAEYLKTIYRPDREYIDGEVVERNMGKWEHARVQALLTMWFGQHERVWGIQTATEWRTRVSGTRVRIPDLVLVGRGRQRDVLDTPPVLAIEILSPGDTYSDTQQRARDYFLMGVQTVWVIDPTTRSARICSGQTWTEAERLTVDGTPIYLDVPTLFAALDEGAEE